MTKRKINPTVKWLLGTSILIAIVSAFIPEFGWGIYMGFVLALIAGYLIKGDVKLFLAALILGGLSTSFSLIPNVGNYLSELFKNIGYVAYGVAGFPAIRVFLSKIGIKL